MEYLHLRINLSIGAVVTDIAAALNALGRTMDVQENESLNKLASHIRNPEDGYNRPLLARAVTEGVDAIKEACQRFLMYGRTVDDNRLEALTQQHEHVGNIDINGLLNRYRHGEDLRLMSLTLQQGVPLHFSFEADDGILFGGSFSFLVLGKEIAHYKFEDFTDTVTFDYTPDVTGQTWLRMKVSDDFTYPELEGAYYLPFKVTWQDYVDYGFDLRMPASFNTSLTSNIKTYAHRLLVDYAVARILFDQYPDGASKYSASADAACAGLIKTLNSRNRFQRTPPPFVV